MVYCNHCGKAVDEGSRFCNHCGAPVDVQGNGGSWNQGATAGDEQNRTRPLYQENPGYGQGSGPIPGSQNMGGYTSGGQGQSGYMSGGYMPGGYMPEKEQPPKKKKTGLVVGVSVAVAAVVAAAAVAVYFFFFAGSLDKFEQYVKDRDWTEAGELYEKKFEGKKKEEDANDILEDAVDLLEDEYDSEDMDASTVKRHLEDIQEFWDDRCVDQLLKEIERKEAASDIIGVWSLVSVESAGVTMDVDEFLMMSGLEGTSNELSIKENGTFHMEVVGESGDGTWQKQGDYQYILIDEAGDSVDLTYEDGKLVLDLQGMATMIFEK